MKSPGRSQSRLQAARNAKDGNRTWRISPVFFILTPVTPLLFYFILLPFLTLFGAASCLSTPRALSNSHTRTHTHTHAFSWIYMHAGKRVESSGSRRSIDIQRQHCFLPEVGAAHGIHSYTFFYKKTLALALQTIALVAVQTLVK